MNTEEIVKLTMLPQPDDETCGATCLHAIYSFYGLRPELSQLIREIPRLETGGTLAVNLGIHALQNGFRATIYTYNLYMFDPTWQEEGVDIPEKLKEQAAFKSDAKIQWATDKYLRYLELGGELAYRELSPLLIREHLDAKIPILTGLNATYLYQCAREFGSEYNDVKGVSMGHFVVLTDFNNTSQEVLVADPLLPNPMSTSHQYWIPVQRVVNSILLGIVTYDANLLIIQKK